MRHLFFALDSPAEAPPPPPPPPPPAPLTAELWTPADGGVMPAGMEGRAGIAWWALHHARVFRNREYGQLVMRDGDRLVHRSAVFPGWFRFPFMKPRDLQIGDTWTDPEHRGRGLAAHAIREVVARKAEPGRTFWYVCTDDNHASIRAVEKAGFALRGVGERTRRLGVRLLGAFEITGPPPAP